MSLSLIASEIGKVVAEGINNASKVEGSVKFNVPQSRMEYPCDYEEPPEGFNPYDSADPYFDDIDPQDVADLPTDPYEGFETEDVQFSDIEKKVTNYIEDLKIKSKCPETISDTPFKASDLEKISPEKVAIRREEFDTMKSDLKRQWEQENARQWPKYENDVYSSNGKLIRKAGSDYDAHHIQPLGMGGKNEVSNITPLNAEVHYDKQGVHASGSPYSDLNKILGGV